MTLMRSQYVLVLIVLALLCITTPVWTQDSQAQAQATSPLPDALAKVPAGQSEITYQNGELTIKANGAPLIEVVRTACTQIGAELEAKSEPSQSVVSIVGPGPAKEVLASLLSDYKVNYAIGGTAEDPNALASVIILPEATASDDKANGDANASPSQDSAANNQEAEQHLAQPTESAAEAVPTLTPAEVKARVGEVRELLTQAQSELATQVPGFTNLNMESVLKEAEAQVKADAAPQAPISLPTSNRPTGRSRHLH